MRRLPSSIARADTRIVYDKKCCSWHWHWHWQMVDSTSAESRGNNIIAALDAEKKLARANTAGRQEFKLKMFQILV